MFNIETYRNSGGYDIVAEYMNTLNQKAATDKSSRIKLKKIFEYIGILQQFGTRAGEPFVKHLEGDLWELRPTNDRIFFFYFKDNKYILLHHFVKNTQKTPKKELEQAKRNMQDHVERSGTK
jgi:phage-related protein